MEDITRTSDIEKLRSAVDDFARAVKARLIQQYDDGYRGWDGKYPEDRLALELNKDSVTLLKGHDIVKTTIDIAARAMFIFYRNV